MIAVLLIAISVVMAGFVYNYNLYQQRDLNNTLVNQLAQSAEKTSAIAAYLEDDDLALEIANGLVANNLVSAVSIVNFEAMAIQVGERSTNRDRISLTLIHPFTRDEVVGELLIYPDDQWLQLQAREFAMQSALGLIVLSLLSAIAVSVFVHRRLTSPILRLTNGFSMVDPHVPETMNSIDIGYRRRDELGNLVNGINALMIALKQNLQTERILRERTQALEQQFRLIYEQASAGIAVVGINNRLLTANPAFFSYFEDKPQEKDFCQLFEHPEKVKRLLGMLRSDEPVEQQSIDLEYRKDGQKRWLHCLFAKLSEQRNKRRHGQEALVEIIIYDITDRKLQEQRTRFEADHDSLTQLRNRRSGEKELKLLLEQGKREQCCFVLMMIDLDKFKPVNDNFGHDVGDEVLVMTSQRMMEHFDERRDVCVRWGGDEFVIGFLQPECDIQAIERLSTELLEELRQPYVISPTITCDLSASIGVVIASDTESDLVDLLVQADETMYQVKQSGRDQFIVTHFT